jgi:hypothetical protein
MVNPFTPAPVYSGGQLVGISDPIRQMSRLPTTSERLVYSRQLPDSKQEADLKRIEEFKKIELDLSRIEKPKEVYDSRSGMFIQDTRGTIQTTRTPTQDERRRIDDLDKNILTADIKKLEERRKEYEKTSKKVSKLKGDIEELEKGNIQDNTWIGSEEDYEKYEKKFKEYERETIRLGEEPTITTGLFGLERDRSISTFDFTEKPISSTFKVFSTTAGAITGVGTERILEKVGVETITSPRLFGEKVGKVIEDPVSFLKSLKPKKQPEVIFDIDKGVARLSTQEDFKKDIVPPSFKITREEIGRGVGTATELGVDIGKYFIPVVGTGIFFAETGEFGVGVGKKLTSGEKLTFEEKLEIGLTSGALLTLGTLKGARYLRQPVLVKGSDDVLRLSTRGDELFGKRIKVSGKGVEVLPSERGILIKRQPLLQDYNVKVAETIGKDIKLIKDARTGEVVLFSKQKIDEITRAGSFVRVEKQGTGLFGKRIKVSGKGIEILPPKTELIFSGASPFTKLGKLERERTINLLTKKGLTEKQAKELIRFQFPKRIERELSGKLFIKDQKARGEFIIETKQPRISVKDDIKTIGRKTKTEKFEVIRDTQLIDEKQIVKEFKTRIGEKEGDLTIGYLTGKEDDLGKMFDISKIDDIKIGKELPAKRITSISIEEKPFEFAINKRLSKPQPQIFVDKQRTILLKEEIDLTTEIGTKFTGKKTPLSKTFQEKVLIQDTLKQAIKVPEIKIRTPTPTPSPVVKELPFMVGGTGLKTIPYAFGTLEFERTATRFSQPTDKLIFPIKGIVDTKTELKTFTDIKSDTKQIEVLKPKEDIKTMDISKSIISPREIIKLKEKTIEMQKTSPMLSQILQTKQIQKATPLIQRTPTRKTPRKPEIKPPKIKIPLKIKTFDTKEDKTKLGDEEAFKVFRRIKGKDVEIETAPTEFLAVEKLKKGLKTDLSASGYIEQFKTKERIPLKKFTGGEFRLAKRDPTRLVQRRGFRLGTKQETYQIKKARKGGFF